MTSKLHEPGTVHRVKKSRKAQACAECGGLIPVGSAYMYLNTHDAKSGRWSRYILCASCERHRSCFSVAELALGTEQSYRAGFLLYEIRERRLLENDFNHEFQIAWLASEPAQTQDPE